MNPSASLAAEYSAKADAYARLWAPAIRPMALPLLDALPLGTARRVLDVGTGTGALLPDIRKAASDATIIGVDRAEGMLCAARRAGRFLLAVTDAQQLGIRSSTIDVAILVFALFHMPEPLQTLRDVRRVLRGGGVVGIVTWGQDPGLPGLSAWTEELDRERAASDPRDPRVMQQAQMDTVQKVQRLVDAADLVSARVWRLTVCHQWAPNDLLAVQTGCGMPARRLASLSAEARARCQSRVKARLAAFTPADLLYRPEVLFAVAQRPA